MGVNRDLCLFLAARSAPLAGACEACPAGAFRRSRARRRKRTPSPRVGRQAASSENAAKRPPASDRGACPEGRGSRIGKRVAEVSGWEVRPSAARWPRRPCGRASVRVSGRRRRRTPRESQSSERPRKAGVFGVFGSRFAGHSRRSPGVGRWVMRGGGVATVLRLSGLGEGTGVARDVPAAVQCRRRVRGVIRPGEAGTFCMVGVIGLEPMTSCM